MSEEVTLTMSQVPFLQHKTNMPLKWRITDIWPREGSALGTLPDYIHTTFEGLLNTSEVLAKQTLNKEGFYIKLSTV